MQKIWIDADPSGQTWSGLDYDDDLAILMALAFTFDSSSPVYLEGISVCGGNAPLSQTSKNINSLLSNVEVIRDGTLLLSMMPPLGIGWRDMNVAWKSYRLLNMISPDMKSSNDASEAIIRAANTTNDPKLTVLMLGPPSNLAKAIQQSPSLPDQLHHVVLMGGELTRQRMDLNFMSDRAAARAVIQSNVPTTIVPIQTCGQVVVTEDVIQQFEDRCCPRAAACALLPKMRQQVRLMPGMVNKVVEKRFYPAIEGENNSRWRPSSDLQYGFVPWDVIALLAMVRPDMFDEWEWHQVSIPPCQEGEPCDGTMVVGPGQIHEPVTFSSWVRIPHVVKNETALLDLAFSELACSVDSISTEHPPLLWGFLLHAIIMIGLLIVTILVLICLVLRCTIRKKSKKRKME